VTAGAADADAVAAVSLLRPALELAWAVARVGEESIPAVPAPKPLRPFLRFARLPDRALGVARKVLDEDDDFRARVAGLADEEKVGPAGVLFLTRPEDWEAGIKTLREAAADEHSAGLEEAEERSARRKLRGAEDAARKAEAALDELRPETARLREELAGERKARRALEDQLSGARAAEAKARAEAGSSRAAAERARRERAEAAEQLASLAARSAVHQHAVAGAAEDDCPSIETPAPSGDAAAEVVPQPAPPADALNQVGRAIAAAAAAAEQLGAALAAAAAALGPADPAAETAAAAAGGDAASGDAGMPGLSGRTIVGDSPPRNLPGSGVMSRRPTGPRRVASGLPPAVFDDSIEAAEHLVRLNGVVLLVDGYNLSKSRWPELPIAEQRQRLTNALGRLAARTGADVHAVFDGSEQPNGQLPAGPRRLVRVSFSPADVEADDVILDMVEGIPLHRPVVVASSDRRVQLGAEARGANVLSAGQLLAVLDR
jgi:predicted RNA-binding protein with PIN domain